MSLLWVWPFLLSWCRTELYLCVYLLCLAANSCLTLCDPHGVQHARLLHPPLSSRVCSNSCPLSWWCYLNILFSVVPFSFCLQSFLISGPFPRSQLFASGDQNIRASASVLPMNILGWFPLGLASLISFQSKGLSRIFSSTAIWNQVFGVQHFFMVQLSHQYMTTGKAIALTRRTFVGKVISLIFIPRNKSVFGDDEEVPSDFGDLWGCP